jgi:drug/metabolite transporter (DMT)-like permease
MPNTQKADQYSPLVWGAFIAISVVWGTTYLGIKVAIEYFPPFLLSGLRHLIGGVIFLLFFGRQLKQLPDATTMGRLALNGCLLMVGANSLVCWAELHISSGLAGILCALSPLYITLMSLVAFRGFRLTWQILLGLMISIVGVVAIAYPNLNADEATAHDFKFGIVLLTVANLCWGLGTISMKKYPVKVPLFAGVGLQMLIAGLVNLVISTCFEQRIALSEVPLKGWEALGYLIVVGSFIGYICYGYVLQHMAVGRVSLHTYINTVVSVLVGWLLLNEPLTAWTMGAMAVILSGVVIVNRAYARMAAKAIIQ